MTSVDSTPESPHPPFIGRSVKVAAPLILVGLASALWYASDRLLYIGPFDRATFGWSIVVPLWAVAPLGAGFGWRGLSSRARITAAICCGIVVGTPIAVLQWLSVAFPACQVGPARQPSEWLLPSIVLGLVVGGGFVLDTLIASIQVRAGQPWRGLALGAVGQVGVIVAAAVIAFPLFFGICQRP